MRLEWYAAWLREESTSWAGVVEAFVIIATRARSENWSLMRRLNIAPGGGPGPAVGEGVGAGGFGLGSSSKGIQN